MSEVDEGAKPPTTPESAAAWDAMLAKNDAARCIAHRKNGERCRRLAIQGATVCRMHGGASRHVKAAARARIENAADRMARELLGIATDDDAPVAVKLAAIKDALDRAGLKPPTQVDVGLVEPKPYEALLVGGMAGGSRAESRARRGVPDTPTHVSLPSAYSGREVLDVQAESLPADSDGADANLPPWATGPTSGPQPATPGTELMTLEEANAALAEDVRRSYQRHR